MTYSGLVTSWGTFWPPTNLRKGLMIPAAPRQRVCTVSIRSGPGASYFSHTTMASTVFEGVAKAKEFFQAGILEGTEADTGDALPGPPGSRRARLSGAGPKPWNDGNGPVEFEDTCNVRDRKNYFRKSEGNQNIERARSACELSARQVSASPGGVARMQMLSFAKNPTRE